MEQDWANHFDSKPPTHTQTQILLEVRTAFKTLAIKLQASCEPGKSKDETLTALKTAAMWASRAVVGN